MQLKPRPIRPALAAAAASLLGSAQAAPLGAPPEPLGEPALPPVPLGYPPFLRHSQARASSLLYREADGRILVWENTLQAARELDEDRRLSLTAVSDLISGASPVGTVPTDSVQTVTGPSGQSTTVAPGELPLFTLTDLRLALSGSYAYPLGPELQGTTGLSYAQERDYQSVGLSQGLTRGWNHDLTTLALGLSLERDRIRPAGGAPPPLAREGSFTLQTGEEADDAPGEGRDSLEWQVGLSQVLSRRLLLQGQYYGGHLSGYLTDPYKRISYVSGTSGEPLPGEGAWTERRPDTRTFHGLALSLLAALPGDAVGRAGLRLFRDDWSVRAASLEAHLDLPLARPGRALVLHGRLYRQSAAWFYHYRLADSAGPLPGLQPGDVTADPATLPAASADWRLGALDDLYLQAGLRQELPAGPWDRAGLRLLLGHLRQTDRRGLFPTLRAWSAFVSLRVDW